ncbi:hypothetical protein HYH02_009427 [Chlamydomonas schloesseri]|uniref:Uncharacterized protein n=1 Tax=Chlamydomonas schloesseri TaxID=2026947 RepID=A0A835TF95_9CHLO|nr:hypothetical protein HYH02_009427 [Chlamydomonas schloesseri]|eukprot:KAG2443011.1 hypothetical protein HYH02_009427 [Chlamydomonas schloesseri]
MALPPVPGAATPEHAGATGASRPGSSGRGVLRASASMAAGALSEAPSPSGGYHPNPRSGYASGASSPAPGPAHQRGLHGSPHGGTLTASPSMASMTPGAASAGNSPLRAGRSSRHSSATSRIDCGPRKLTQAQQVERLHAQLLEMLHSEWRNIKTTNLGVLSGTAVVEELLLRRVGAWARELHMLAITHASASERLADLCRAMSTQELQQMQVMFDVTGHPELSDYCRLMVYNTADPNAKAVVGDLGALRAASAARRSRSTPSSRRRAPPPPPPRPHNRYADDPHAMRFAGLLPDGHRLVSGAHAARERRLREEDEARRAAEAKAARARARAEAAEGRGRGAADSGAEGDTEAERRAAEASARAALLHARNPLPEVLPYYLADVEDQWRRTVLKRGVVGAGGAADASLPASEGVFDSRIMLADPLPPYEAPPEAARLRAEQEAEAALAAAQAQALAFGPPSSRGTAGSFLSSINTLASVRAAPPTPAGPQRAGAMAAPWSGPGTPGLGAGNRGGPPGVSRHGSVTGAPPPGLGLGGAGGAGWQEGTAGGAGGGSAAGSGAAGPGSSAAALTGSGGAGPSRFAGSSRAGPRPPPVAVPPPPDASA